MCGVRLEARGTDGSVAFHCASGGKAAKAEAKAAAADANQGGSGLELKTAASARGQGGGQDQGARWRQRSGGNVYVFRIFAACSELAEIPRCSRAGCSSSMLKPADLSVSKRSKAAESESTDVVIPVAAGFSGMPRSSLPLPSDLERSRRTDSRSGSGSSASGGGELCVQPIDLSTLRIDWPRRLGADWQPSPLPFSLFGSSRN